MDYIDQLNTSEWSTKRKVILERDKYKCTVCNNKQIILPNKIGIISINNKKHTVSKFYDISIINLAENKANRCKLFKGTIPFSININKKICLYRTFDDKAYIQAILDKELKAKPNLAVDLNNFPKYSDFYKDNITLKDLICNINNINWLYVFNLHIHHKYYQIGKMAWEYPDEALTTMCWDCHEKLHENSEIIIKDEKGRFVENRKACSRCHGAGWFPEYKHIINGVCFKCEGKRFEV